MPRNHRRRRRLAALLAVAALMLLALPLALSAAQSNPGQRIDLKVLVIAPGPDDSVAAAWRSALDGEGVPNETRVVSPTAPDLGDGDLADYGANRAYYQAVIVAWGNMPMTAGETAALDRFQSTFGLRMLRDNTTPDPAFGLNPTEPAEQGGKVAALTNPGKGLFPYLHGNVPIDAPAFGYEATPATPAFTTLLASPGGSSYLGIHRRAGGPEEMISTLTGGRFQTHHQLLRHGIITWVTGGVFLGHQRNYYEMQVDDIFLPNDRWDVNENKTGVDEPTTAPDEYQCDRDVGPPIRDCLPAIRMQPADVARTTQWQRDNGLKLDMVFNGFGSDEAKQENGGSDPLTDAYLASKSEFPWINHTFTHPKLHTVPRSTIVNEVSSNVRWAADHGISIDPTELVTGEHSGLDNPDMPDALQELGIRWIASDNSRESSQRAIGPAITIPRYPSNVYYNVGKEVEQLDEYNFIYQRPPAGKCVETPVNTCRAADDPATWDEYVASEANIMFDHVMDNDPRPHYAHQSNLTLENAGDGKPVLLEVMDAVLARYRPYVKLPIVQLSHTAIGEELQRRARWNADRAGVSAYLQDGFVHFTNTTPRAVPVPVTGTEIGTLYGGQRSGWITLEPQQTTSTAAPAAGKPRQTARIALKSVKIKPKRFPVTGQRKRRGARISWNVSQAGTLQMTFQRRTTGRKVGRTCRKTTRRNRGRKRCHRYVSVGTLSRSVRAGNGRYKFSGKVRRRVRGKVRSRRLSRGTYRLVATAQARDRAAGTSVPNRVGFSVVKARSRRR